MTSGAMDNIDAKLMLYFFTVGLIAGVYLTLAFHEPGVRPIYIPTFIEKTDKAVQHD